MGYTTDLILLTGCYNCRFVKEPASASARQWDPGSGPQSQRHLSQNKKPNRIRGHEEYINQLQLNVTKKTK